MGNIARATQSRAPQAVVHMIINPGWSKIFTVLERIDHTGVDIGKYLVEGLRCLQILFLGYPTKDLA